MIFAMGLDGPPLQPDPRAAGEEDPLAAHPPGDTAEVDEDGSPEDPEGPVDVEVPRA